MVKNILKIVIMIVAVVAGGIGASFLKSVSEPSEVSVEGHADSRDGKKAERGGDKKGHGKEGEETTTTYMKFKRQFVIPVMKENKIKSLVIMNFNIELNDAAPPNAFNKEPKLRDAFMRDLLNLSNEGVFDDDLTSPETFDYIRETLVGSSRRILSQGVENVLILDVAKRDT